MKKLNLNGNWQLHMNSNNKNYEAYVPVSDYNALLKCGEIEDPFYKTNENKCLFISEADKSFTRTFTIEKELLNSKNIILSCEMLDTLAEIYINGKNAGHAENAYICHRFDIKELLSQGDNSIEIKFKSPVNFVKEMQKKDPLPRNANGINGVAHIRKPACHFGWDWGINMPISGIIGNIDVLFYDKEILDFDISQTHTNGRVILDICTDIPADTNGEIICPDNQSMIFEIKNGKAAVEIEKPELWWTRELSGKEKQPLYIIKIGEISKRIGLRTIELNRRADKYGSNFQFILNGVPIFAKGSNLIPPDAMGDRINKEAYQKIIDDAVFANFNMLRVWGGGYYGSDEFYDLCDENGILVWQDFMFACLMYPFYDEAFLANVLAEVKYNVCRIKHHPSLALWCGNNEIEFMFSYMPESAKIVKWYQKFFYEILPNELRKYDKATDYIETSPIGAGFRKSITADKHGDTHMWHVWHGSKDLKYYTKRFTRFCSEYGMESLPSEDCIMDFADESEMNIYSESMLHHQKCLSGNSKMLFYLAEKYKKPDSFKDLIYLTGLIQAQCVGNAAEHWRRNRGRCNGALWWQLNDCWGAPSWSSVDYYGKWKPLMYEAKKFFAPLAVSIKENRKKAEIFVLNDTLADEKLTVELKAIDFSGKTIISESLDINSKAGKSLKVLEASLNKLDKKNVFLQALLYKDSHLISEKTAVLLPERELNLKRAKIKVIIDGNTLTFTSNTYARKVFVDIKGEKKPLSDNCFDLIPGIPKTIYINNDKKIDAKSLSVKCVNNIKSSESDLSRILFRLGFSLKPENIANRIYYSVS